MDFIDGFSAQDVWFDVSIDTAEVEQRGMRILDGVARAMLQLIKFTHSRGGALVFDDNGSVVDNGPTTTHDAIAEVEKLHSRGFGSDSNDNDKHLPLFVTAGPFLDLQTYFLQDINRREPPESFYIGGTLKLLRLYVEWLVPRSQQPDEQHHPEFALTHPDLDIQNIIVAKDGDLAGIIDWDGVTAVPQCVPNNRFPSWLTRDWDPARYRPPTDTDARSAHAHAPRENTPAELARYRSLYLDLLLQHGANERHLQTLKLALLIENLYIAANDPICTPQIVEVVFNRSEKAMERSKYDYQAADLAGEDEGIDSDDGSDNDSVEEDSSDPEDLYLYDFVTEQIETDDKRVERVKEAFYSLYDALTEWDEDIQSTVSFWEERK
jgi:hypothetical protein